MMQKRKAGQPHKGWKASARKKLERRKAFQGQKSTNPYPDGVYQFPFAGPYK